MLSLYLIIAYMTTTALILDGLGPADPLRARVTARLGQALTDRCLAFDIVTIRDLRLGSCCGCFECFVRHPGLCRMRDDAASVLDAMTDSQLMVWLGRVSVGGYSAELKRIVDRVLPLLLPFFGSRHGEFHHPPRHPNRPRLVALGIAPERAQALDARQARIFSTLAGRNAINLSAPSFSAQILAGDASDAELTGQIQTVLDRSDPWPWASELRALAPRPHPVRPDTPQLGPKPRVLSLVGSPKLGPSSSFAISDYVSKILSSLGWETECLKLRGDLKTSTGQDALVAAVDRADLVNLAFPLYVDALPTLPTLALEILLSQASRWTARPKRLMAVANCGFPEAHQNLLALAICERFALQSGWHWCGGLALGAGEGISSGMPLDAPPRSGRLPSHNLRQALDSSLKAIASGQNIPESAQALLDKSPIPGLPQFAWRVVYRVMGHRGWRAQARQWGAPNLKAEPASRLAASSRVSWSR